MLIILLMLKSAFFWERNSFMDEIKKDIRKSPGVRIIGLVLMLAAAIAVVCAVVFIMQAGIQEQKELTWDNVLSSADKMYNEGNFEGALSKYLEAINMAEGREEGYIGAAKCYFAQNKYTYAKNLLNSFLQKMPETSNEFKAIQAKINIVGNTAGNITNGGYFAKQGGYIYFSNSEDNGFLYRMDIDGGNKKAICAENCSYINVLEDYIYYCNLSDNGFLYRMKLDGSEKQRLTEIKCSNINVGFENGAVWIYFISPSEGNKIYKIKNDGNEVKELFIYNSRNLCLAGEWLYFSNEEDFGKIYRMRLDGSDKDRINLVYSANLSVDGGIVYFCNTHKNYLLNSMKFDTAERTDLSEEGIQSFIVSEGYVYFVTRAEKNKIYKRPLSGGGAELLYEGSYISYAVFGEELYIKK